MNLDVQLDISLKEIYINPLNIKIKDMKKIVVLAIALFTITGFAQKRDSERPHKDRKERKEKISPEKRAEIQSKKLTLALDLSEQQQSKVETVLLEHFKEGKEKMEAQKKPRKELTQDERHQLLNEKLDAQIALKAEMKSILNETQYSKYTKMMGRRSQQRKGRGRKSKKRD